MRVTVPYVMSNVVSDRRPIRTIVPFIGPFILARMNNFRFLCGVGTSA